MVTKTNVAVVFLLYSLFLKYCCLDATLLIGKLSMASADDFDFGAVDQLTRPGFWVTGALFSNNNSLELNEETVFKHAVYISNQFKFSFINAPPNYPTLMHKSIHINNADQLKTIKKGKKPVLRSELDTWTGF